MGLRLQPCARSSARGHDGSRSQAGAVRLPRGVLGACHFVRPAPGPAEQRGHREAIEGDCLCCCGGVGGGGRGGGRGGGLGAGRGRAGGVRRGEQGQRLRRAAAGGGGTPQRWRERCERANGSRQGRLVRPWCGRLVLSRFVGALRLFLNLANRFPTDTPSFPPTPGRASATLRAPRSASSSSSSPAAAWARSTTSSL